MRVFLVTVICTFSKPARDFSNTLSPVVTVAGQTAHLGFPDLTLAVMHQARSWLKVYGNHKNIHATPI